MRKIILLLLTVTYAICNGQEANILTTVTNPAYIYVGSLPKSSESVYQKLKIEVFGGRFESNNLGVTTYIIGTRQNNYVNIERSGGETSCFKLIVYENGNSYDFVIQTTFRYVSLNINSVLLHTDLRNTTSSKKNIEIKLYDPANKNDVTSSFKETIITATDQYGNLGIGTLSPQSKLDVRGKITASEVEVKVNTGADHVFYPDYALMPLSEVESFVKENKHLPDIPSEKQMVENGLNVNEMQIKLLQKIEELTLYVIEQDKKIEKQNRIIQELQNQQDN